MRMRSDLYATWGQRIRDARLAAGHTQVSVADALLVDKSTVAHWESGLTIPRDANRAALARLFAVPACRLFPYGDLCDDGQAA
jgi:transcriptional regulator with XRE-family HTH domain